MWLQQDKPDELLLVLEESDTAQSTMKEEIHISVKITRNGTVRWRYLYHQPYQRAIPSLPWEKNPVTRRSLLSLSLFHDIQSRVTSELVDLILVVQSEDEPGVDLDPPRGFDRRTTLLTLLAAAVTRMLSPSPISASSRDSSPSLGIAQSVTTIRKAAGLGVGEFASAVMTNRTTILWLESGKRSAAPTTLRNIALMGRRYKQWKAADFLESHALVAEGQVRHKGGHR